MFFILRYINSTVSRQAVSRTTSWLHIIIDAIRVDKRGNDYSFNSLAMVDTLWVIQLSFYHISPSGVHSGYALFVDLHMAVRINCRLLGPWVYGH